MSRRPQAYRAVSARLHESRGVALLVTFLMMLVLSGLALAVGVSAFNSQVGGKSYLQDRQVFYIAEAGLERGRQQLVAGNWTAASCTSGSPCTESFGAGTYQVTITDNGGGLYTLISNAYLPNDTHPVAQRQVVETNLTYASGGSSNLSLSATAWASSSQGSRTPEKANDGSMTTSWSASTQGNGEWLRLDFGSSMTLAQVVIHEKDNITGVTVESSDNGSSWATVPGLTHDGDTSDTTWTIDFTSTSDQYYRAVFTASGSNKKVHVNEFESYDSSGSPAITQDGEFTTAW